VKAIKQRWLVVRGEFTVRGGMRSVVEAHYPVRGKPPGKRD
jgi:hypothetical protein